MSLEINWQPTNLENDIIRLRPLTESDFELLYAVASDPLIWELHPVKDRYKKDVFQNFFTIAIQSQSAFVIIDKADQRIIGTTRYWDYNSEESCIEIGYTFIARDYWGTQFNRACKKLLLDYAFQHVENVVFMVGTENFRSQKAVEKLGGKKVQGVKIELQISGHSIPHYKYITTKNDWINHLS